MIFNSQGAAELKQFINGGTITPGDEVVLPKGAELLGDITIEAVDLEGIRQEGYNSGYSLGYEEGYTAGYAKGQEEALPYATELQYIESTGTQWIKSGFVVDSSIANCKIVADMAIVSTGATWRVTGCGGDLPVVYFGIAATGYIAYGKGDNDFITSTRGDSGRHTWTFDIKNRRMSCSGLLDTSINFVTPSASRNFAISAYTTANGAATCHAQRIYSYKFYKNDVLVGDYIPVLDKAGVACLYDKVEKQLYYNQGSGSFSYALVA